MTNREHDPSALEVQRLVSALIDGTIAEDERRQLIERMQTDPHARQAYLELLELDSFLQWDAASMSLADVEGTPPPASLVSFPAASGAPARQVAILRWSLAATVLLCVGLAALLGLQLAAERAVAYTTARSSEGGPVAILTDLRQAVWETSAPSPEAYKPLVPGWLKLRSGHVALDFLGGAKATLEGPAEFGLNAADRGVLRLGKLSIVLGRNRGAFRVTAPALVASSRGAEFALAVASDGTTELHVFSGSVTANLAAADDEPKAIEVGEGEAISVQRVDDRAAYRPMSAEPDRFASPVQTAIGEPAGEVVSVDFSRQPALSYGYQDGQFGLPTGHKVLDGGRTLFLSGNAWKMIEVNVELTRDTVIEFEFRSPREGQIHGIGLDNDDTYSSSADPVFQVYGYEARRDIGQQFNDYAGDGWRRYRLRVGRYLSLGPRRYLFFAADEDVTGDAESYFRNVRIYRAKNR